MTVEQIARVCHLTNKAYCEVLGDDSQPTWEDAPDWQKISAMDGVIFRLGNPLAPDWTMHKNWLDQKERDGWTFGAVKDPEKKEHPCMVDFNDLPVTQKAKDTLFSAVVNSLRPLYDDQGR